MRVLFLIWSVLGSVMITCGGICFASPPVQEELSAKKSDSGELVVHEWGTFTSVTGADGSRLEFRPLVDNDLPEFVVNRAWQAGRIPNPFGKWELRSLQRMETPVTYFYTDRERDVNVKVGFPKGLLTEFYPPVVSMKPEFNFNKRASIGNSELDWGKVTLIPMNCLTPKLSSPEVTDAAHRRLMETLAPDSHSHPHYVHARQTDSAFVYVPHQKDESRPLAPVGDHFEKFLFYRGIGNFPLPVSVIAKGENVFEVSNDGNGELRSLFLVTLEEGSLFAQKIESLAPGKKIMITQNPGSIDFHLLSNMVVESLVAEGLYEKEARAMVNTWKDSWFAEQGTRLFYTLPQSLTDELLPLSISPAPDEIVRVMVGRLEILCPEDEARIVEMIRASAKVRLAAREAQTPNEMALPQAVIEMGRLAEPALVRAKSFTTDEVVRVEAGLLLQELQQFQAGTSN